MKTAKIKLTKRNKSIANKGILFCIIALAFPVAHFLFMFFLQNGGTFVLSFQEFSIKSGNFEFIGWKNFTTIFRILGSEYSEFPLALRNSFIFFLLNNFFILPISICCAIVCYKRIPLSNVFRVILFLPTVISPVVLAMVYRFAGDSTVGFIPELLEQLHLTNLIPVLGFLADKQTAMPLLLFYCVWIGLGGSIILLTGAIAKIPDHLIELDRLYGLSFIKEVWYVILPLIGPTVSILFLQGLGVILGFYMPVLLITGGAADTTTYAFFTIQLTNGGQSNYGFTAALSLVSTLIMSPIILICRYFIDKFFPAYEY